MNQEDNYWLQKRLAQDSIPILLMLFGVASAFFELQYDWSGLFYPVWSILVVLAGAVLGVYFAAKRDISKSGRPGVLAIVAGICWGVMILAIMLLQFFPGFYGYDLAILFNSMAAIFWSGLLGIIFTIAALLR